MMDYDWRDLLDFWFGQLDSSGVPDALHRKRWFKGGAGFDEAIRQRFQPLMARVSRGGLAPWRDEPEGLLAQIILLDQFSRNIYRGTAMAFEQDRLAMQLCRSGVARRLDPPLPAFFRAFFYMPFQHSESLADQDQGIELFQALVDAAAPEQVSLLRGFLASAREHRAIIARFGRFPHRNALLGRSSSDAEVRFLRQGGKRFGQPSKQGGC